MAKAKGIEVLDVRGAMCPIPLIETVKKIKELKKGEMLVVYLTDEGASIDIPDWAKKAKHEVLEIKREDGYWKIVIRKNSS